MRNRSRQWSGSITQKRASQRSQEGSTTSPIHPKREEIKREREREREREIRLPIPLLRISLSRSLCLSRSSLAPPPYHAVGSFLSLRGASWSTSACRCRALFLAHLLQDTKTTRKTTTRPMAPPMASARSNSSEKEAVGGRREKEDGE